MRNGKIAKKEAKVRAGFLMPAHLHKEAMKFVVDHPKKYRGGGFSQFACEAIAEKLGVYTKYSFKCGECYINILATYKFCPVCGASTKTRITVS